MGPLVRSYGLKPDLSAPGVGINAAASQAVPGIEGMYRSMDGTSTATPHVVGAVLPRGARDHIACGVSGE